jgi:hypothetical protein
LTNINRQALGVIATTLKFSPSHGLRQWQHDQFGIPLKVLKEGRSMAVELKSGESEVWARQRGKVRSDVSDPQHLDAARECWLTKTRPSEISGNTLHAPKDAKTTHVKHHLDVRIQDFYAAFVMAGLGLFDQKSAIAVTMPIFTAFKFCIRHRKNGLLNR